MKGKLYTTDADFACPAFHTITATHIIFTVLNMHHCLYILHSQRFHGHCSIFILTVQIGHYECTISALNVLTVAVICTMFAMLKVHL